MMVARFQSKGWGRAISFVGGRLLDGWQVYELFAPKPGSSGRSNPGRMRTILGSVSDLLEPIAEIFDLIRCLSHIDLC